jgi:hypothetical protein
MKLKGNPYKEAGGSKGQDDNTSRTSENRSWASVPPPSQEHADAEREPSESGTHGPKVSAARSLEIIKEMRPVRPYGLTRFENITIRAIDFLADLEQSIEEHAGHGEEEFGREASILYHQMRWQSTEFIGIIGEIAEKQQLEAVLRKVNVHKQVTIARATAERLMLTRKRLTSRQGAQ